MHTLCEPDIPKTVKPTLWETLGGNYPKFFLYIVLRSTMSKEVKSV